MSEQPRVPAGSSEGGQWAPTGGTLVGRAAVEARGPLAQLSKPERRQLQKVLDDADEALPSGAQDAVTAFVGHGPKAREYAEETGGFGVMSERRLEDAMSDHPSPEGLIVRDQLEETFSPVREQLRAQFGDSVDLFRVQREVAEDAKTRNVLSFTMSRQFAKDYAGASHEAKVYSAKEINDMEAKANVTGEVEVGNHILRRGTGGWWDIYEKADEYGGEQHITDTESPREYITNENAWAVETNQANSVKLNKVVRTKVPLDRVVWATQRANQWEFIVKTGGARKASDLAWTPAREVRPTPPDIRKPTDA